MRFSLQKMVQQTMAEAERREMAKLAEAAPAEDQKKKDEKKQGPPAAKTPPDNTNTAPERNDESYEEKTSSAFVEKLASAVAWCNEHFIKEAVGEPEPPRSHDPPGAPGVGPGEGTGVLEINKQPTPGTQSTETGQASSQGKVPATNPPADSPSPGQTNPATAIHTDMNERPGGTEDWTNKDVMKQAASRDFYKAKGLKRVKQLLSGAYKRGLETSTPGADRVKREARKVLATRVGAGAAGAGALGGAGYGISKLVGKKKDKKKEASVARVLGVMNKMAEDANNPAKIGASTTNPHQSSPEGVSAAGEGGKPPVPGEVSKQESMVGSNEAATNYTKQQAKAVPKARMGEVLDEPAQKKSTDPVLHQNLDAASGAGVKLSSITKRAAAEALLRKIAQEGESESASPEQKEKAQKLQELLATKQQEKESGACKQGSSMPLSGGY